MSNRKQKLWTCDEDAQLMREHSANMHINRIAQEHGRTEGAIKDRLTKHLFHATLNAKCSGLEVTEEDLDHLSFIYERMAHVHGENRQVDYMLRFRRIIATLKTIA